MKTVLYDYETYLALLCPFCTALVNPALRLSTGIFRIVEL